MVTEYFHFACGKLQAVVNLHGDMHMTLKKEADIEVFAHKNIKIQRLHILA